MILSKFFLILLVLFGQPALTVASSNTITTTSTNGINESNNAQHYSNNHHEEQHDDQWSPRKKPAIAVQQSEEEDEEGQFIQDTSSTSTSTSTTSTSTTTPSNTEAPILRKRNSSSILSSYIYHHIPNQTLYKESDGATSTQATKEEMILESANLRDGVMVDDSNFRTLVQHCLKSHAENACQAMAQWDVSRVTDCSSMFWEPVGNGQTWQLLKGADHFNVDLSQWNTTGCTTMKSMFYGASSFDIDIGNWDTSQVTDMSHMFQSARKFNRDISRWNTALVRNMQHMFSYASNFHVHDLSQWNTARVTNMASMFHSASHFNGILSNWNTARNQQFQHMFHNADMFNSDIGTWDVGGAIDGSNSVAFVSMFEGARDFNQDLSHWDMSDVNRLDNMFQEAHSFNHDLSYWNLREVTSMVDMFHNAKAFQQDLCWDVSQKEVGDFFLDGTLNASVVSSSKTDNDLSTMSMAECWSSKHLPSPSQPQTSSTNIGPAAKPHTTGAKQGSKESSVGNVLVKLLRVTLITFVALLTIYLAYILWQFFHGKDGRTKNETVNDDDEQGPDVQKPNHAMIQRLQRMRGLKDHINNHNSDEEEIVSFDNQTQPNVLFPQDLMLAANYRRYFSDAKRSNESTTTSDDEPAPFMAQLLQQEHHLQQLMEQQLEYTLADASERSERSQRHYIPGASVRQLARSSPSLSTPSNPSTTAQENTGAQYLSTQQEVEPKPVTDTVEWVSVNSDGSSNGAVSVSSFSTTSGIYVEEEKGLTQYQDNKTDDEFESTQGPARFMAKLVTPPGILRTMGRSQGLHQFQEKKNRDGLLADSFEDGPTWA